MKKLILPAFIVTVLLFSAGCKKCYRCFNECVGSSRVDLQACKLEYSIVSPK